MYVIPGSKVYRQCKYEQTENFNDLRKNLTMEANLKKKAATITKMARFKGRKEVEDLMNSMKTNTTERDYEVLVLACLSVYATELMDTTSAQTFFEKLTTDMSKIKVSLCCKHNQFKGYILMNQLKEAYLLAVKIDSREDIRAIRDEALTAGNTRVQQLCEQYHSTPL